MVKRLAIGKLHLNSTQLNTYECCKLSAISRCVSIIMLHLSCIASSLLHGTYGLLPRACSIHHLAVPSPPPPLPSPPPRPGPAPPPGPPAPPVGCHASTLSEPAAAALAPGGTPPRGSLPRAMEQQIHHRYQQQKVQQSLDMQQHQQHQLILNLHQHQQHQQHRLVPLHGRQPTVSEPRTVPSCP